MQTTPEQRREIGALFAGLSASQVHERCVQALREWRSASPAENTFSMHGHLGLRLLNILAGSPPGTLSDVGALKEAFLDAHQEPWMVPILEFTQWLVGAGYAMALSPGAGSLYPISYRVLPRGLAFLELPQSHEHPLMPGAVERLRSRCESIPDGIVTLLVDARTCLERTLYRPAVVLTGVASEAAIEEILESHVRGQQRTAIPRSAAERIVSLRESLDALLPGRHGPALEQRRAAGDALVFADQLRARRNDASHTRPRYGFEDGPEVEELLVSAARHLPALWALSRS